MNDSQEDSILKTAVAFLLRDTHLGQCMHDTEGMIHDDVHATPTDVVNY